MCAAPCILKEEASQAAVCHAAPVGRPLLPLHQGGAYQHLPGGCQSRGVRQPLALQVQAGLHGAQTAATTEGSALSLSMEVYTSPQPCLAYLSDDGAHQVVCELLLDAVHRALATQ